MKDVAESHDTLIQLFERIHFFVQRLKSYTGMQLTNELTELLGKIMAQLLRILALSTKAMTDNIISKFIRSLCFSLADYGSEKILKRLLGRKGVEEAVSQLDMLTKEESLMVVVRNLEIIQDVDGNVKATKVLAEDIDGNVKATMVLAENIGDSVNAAKILTEDIDGDVKATKVLVEDNAKGIERVAQRVDNGTKHYLSIFVHIPTLFQSCPIIVTHELRRLSRPDTLLLILKVDTRSQGTRCRRSSDHGCLHQIHPSITILHAKLNTAGQQRGLSKATRSKIGRGMAHYYGSVEIVRFSRSFYLYIY